MKKLAFVFLVISFCVHAQTESDKPFVLGVIHEIQSDILSEQRIVNVYLPDGYSPDDTVKYSVIYLLDGSVGEDFIHIVGLVQFNTFPWVNRLPQSIVVGIANTDRKRDFTFPTTVQEDLERFPGTGHSDRFMAFIEKELQPFIEKKYKTTCLKTIIGQSLGGLLTTEILLKKPHLFDRYIIVSPSLWWDNGSLLNIDSDIFLSNFSQKIEVYIGVGKEGLTPTVIPRVMEVDANVLADRIKQIDNDNITLYFDYLPDENHATILHRAVLNAFKVLAFE